MFPIELYYFYEILQYLRRIMLPSLESFVCPCCATATLHSLSQYGVYFLAQSLLLIKPNSLSTAVKLSNSLPTIALGNAPHLPDRTEIV